MKIRIRLIVLLTGLICLFFISFLVFRNFERRTLVLLFEKTMQEKESVFDNLIKLKGRSLETLARDYTYWDEMVNFIKNSDIAWAKINLETSFNTYGNNVVWAFKTDYSLVYSANNLEDDTLGELPIFKDVAKFKQLFAEDGRFCHFFIETENGLLEIRGATAHPSADDERITEPQGYFLCGKLWNQEYISELSKLTGCKIEIISLSDENIGKKRSDPNNGQIVFSRALTSWNLAPLKKLRMVTFSDSIVDFNKRSKQYFILNVFFSLLIIVVFAFFIIKWVGSPLHLISKTLELDNLKYVKRLLNDNTEFGDVSRLIAKFFSQKEELVKEIDHRIKIEADLISNREGFYNIVERSQDGIVVVDSAETVRFTNLVAKMLLGKNDLLGKKFIYPVVFGNNMEIEIFRTSKDKGTGEMRIMATEWERQPGYLISIVDITIQKEIEKRQRLSELGKLVADMAHEINNPLMIISGNAQVALMENIENRELKNNLELILQESLRAKNIIQRILKFSRPSKHQLKEVDINKSIDEIIVLLERQFYLNGIEIKKNFVKDPPLILIDEHQIQEVFVNLLNNAREAMTRGGSIEVTTELEGEYIKISFRDSGGGIPAEIMQRIFEPFFTTKEKGTGLGLPLCYGIVRSYNGDLKIESVLGQGTTVSMLLPLKGADNNA